MQHMQIHGRLDHFMQDMFHKIWTKRKIDMKTLAKN